MTSIDPLEAVAIRAGHKELLGTLRELIDEALSGGRTPDPGALRATLAFLRQGVLSFARREERVLSRDPDAWDTAAFEHAFLAAELDRLASEAGVLLGGREAGEAERADAARRVHRTLARIEAVMELHVAREDERELFAPPEVPRERRSAAPHPPDGMTSAEIEGFLRARPWGILCTLGDGHPYAVPVRYGFDGRSVFIASGPGRKASNLALNPNVCFTVPDVVDGTRWRCVVVTGVAHPVGTLAGRISAVRALAASPGEGKVSGADWKRLSRASLFRIAPVEITGRQRGE